MRFSIQSKLLSKSYKNLFKNKDNMIENYNEIDIWNKNLWNFENHSPSIYKKYVSTKRYKKVQNKYMSSKYLNWKTLVHSATIWNDLSHHTNSTEIPKTFKLRKTWKEPLHNLYSKYVEFYLTGIFMIFSVT